MFLIGDYVEMGARLWHTAQTVNDIAGIERKYRGKLTIEGEWNSQGVPGMVEATEEDIRKETRRCLEEYGHEGGYILLPVLVDESGYSTMTGRDRRLPALADEWNRHRML